MSTRLLAILFFLAMVTFPCSLLAQSWQSYASFDGGYAIIDGYTQIPRGGTVGTTSLGRPDFHEININHDWITKLGMGVQVEDYFLELDYLRLQAKGENILTENLITHFRFIPAGSDFEMHVRYDWYRLSIGKDFNFRNTWRLTPLLYGNWLKFYYHFTSPFAQSTRYFTLLALSGAVKIEYFFTKNFSAEAQGEFRIPVNHVKIYSALFGLNYSIYISRQTILTPRITLSYFDIDYQDEQPVPNHIHYTAKPCILVGMVIRFI